MSRGREADDLAVAADRLAVGDRPDGGFVAGGNALGRGGAVGERGPGQQRHAGDDHVVVGMETDDGGRGHGGGLRAKRWNDERSRCVVLSEHLVH